MIPRLLVLTDRSQVPGRRTLVEQVEGCLAGGATHVVLRELDLSPSARAELVEPLTRMGAVVIAAHDPLPGAVGMHLPGWADPAPRPDRKGPLGRSCHSVADVDRAAEEGADYATLSPYAASRSKPGHGPVLPPAAYRNLPIPTLALGGVDHRNAAAARAAGAHGVAVMGALMRTTDPEGMTRRLVEALR